MTTYGQVPEWYNTVEDGYLQEEGSDTCYSQARTAGIGSGKLARMRITSFDVENDPKAYEQAIVWLTAHLEGTHPEDGGWLFLQGMNGRGKTHLAVSLLHLLIWANPCLQGGRGYTWSLYDTAGFYAPWAEVTSGYEAWNAVEADVMKARYLVIDDLTKRRATPWSLEVLYEVVDGRDREDKITIFTSNTALPDLFRWYLGQTGKQDREIVSQASLAIIGRIQQRIRYPAGSWLVTMAGQDRRTM